MLENAGVPFVREPADIDEDAIKAEHRSRGASGKETALALAEGKARHLSSRHPGVLVVGADQILECQGAWFDKPANRAEAAQTLRALRDRVHVLTSAVTVVRDDTCLWRFADTASLTMRPFSEAFLRRYVEQAGEAFLEFVGAYRIEGTGIQLFSHIEGDHFTILGMPLLPLLDFLRRNGFIQD